MPSAAQKKSLKKKATQPPIRKALQKAKVADKSNAKVPTAEKKCHFEESGKLKANTSYRTGDYNYEYTTDEKGRIVNAVADPLRIRERDYRLKHDPDTPDKLSGDHAGHIFGDLFGGSPELDNLVSQAQAVNLSEFRKLEIEWANALRADPPEKVVVDIVIEYDDNHRPVAFQVLSIIGTHPNDTTRFEHIVQ